MKKIILLMTAFLMVVVVRAQDVDCDQGDDSNGFENGFQIGATTNFENADDFLVSAGNTLNIQTISLNILAEVPITQIELVFYDDNNGAPGNVLPQSVISSPDTEHMVLIGEAFTVYNVYQIYVDVNLDFEGGADGATYWMQPLATGGTGSTSIFWEVTSEGSLGEPVNGRGTADAPGGPWSADEDGFHGVFKLYCEQTDPPEPPVLPCVASFSNNVEPITRVVFSDIDNTSSAAVDGSPGLEDFTDIEGHVEQGIAYDIALEGNTSGGYTSFFTVFIDYSGEWSDFEIFEIGSISSSTGTDGQQATGTITIDGSVADGTYTMRIIKNYNSSPINPCSGYGWGQAEDYTLIVGTGGEVELYCIPEGGANNGDEILNFTLADLSNDSEPSEGVAGYSDYSESVDPANIQSGESYVASLTSGGGGLPHGAAIWIDYNDNGVFQASEMVTSIPASIEPNTTVNFPSFTVADFPGTHRLRVQYSYGVDGVDMDPCTVTNFTETEDYSVEVAEMETCEGTPESGVADDDFSVCANASFNVSVTGATPAANGLVRMWESSLAGAGVWSEISGAITATYVVAQGITVPMDYRYKLSCNEGDFVFSDIISVSLKPIAECYCIPYFMLDCWLTDDMVDDFILIGDDGTSIDDQATGCSDDGYDDRTDRSVSLTQGDDYTATVTTGAGVANDAVAIWIDFNDDAIFDESERVAGGDLDTSTEIALSIPANAVLGEHRMRVMVYYDDSNITGEINSCNDAGYEFGETHDYTVVILSSGDYDDCAQGDDSNDFENGFQIGAATDFENADDFFVSPGNTLNIQTISLNIITEQLIDQIEFVFYDDNNGTPGDVLPQSVINSPDADHQVIIGAAFGRNVYQVYVDVDLDFEGGAAGAAYWMQPKVTAAEGFTSVFWEVTSAGNLGQPVNGRELAGPWSADEDGFHGVFKLYCEQTDPPQAPILPCEFEIVLDIEPITHVVFSDIDNTSGAAIDGSPALENFTSIIGHVVPGVSYNIAVEGNTNGNFSNFFTAFIDYSGEDQGEWTDFDMFEIGSIAGSSGTDGQQAIGTITLNESVPHGTYTMRVIKSYGASPIDPCGSYNYGQAEDYTINVAGYDCPDVEANIGDDCDDGDVMTENDMYNAACECVGTPLVSTSNLTGFNFTMYPNPVGSNESVTLTSNQAIDRYEVLDIAGKVIDAKTISNQNEIKIALTNYSAGMYILKAYSGSDFSTQKMVVR